MMGYLSRKFLVDIFENDRSKKEVNSKVIAKNLRCIFQPSIDTANTERTQTTISFSTKAKICFSRPYQLDMKVIKKGQTAIVFNHTSTKIGEYSISDTIPGNNNFVILLDRRSNG